MQQRVGAHERVALGDFGGCVEIPHVNDMLDRPVGGAGCEKLRPILRRFRAQGEGVVAGCGEFLTGPRKAAACSGGAELRGESIAESRGVSEDKPRLFRGRLRLSSGGVLLPRSPGERAEQALAAGRSDEPWERSRLAEARLFQHALPLRAFQQRLLRTQVAIGEAPPAAREAEDRFGPQLRRRGVHEDEAAARREQVAQMAERRAHIAHRVQHVGADDEVERLRGEILFGAGFFEIENLALDLGEGGELLHRAGEEARRDIGERVGVQAALEQRQHLRREPGGAAADFEDAQSAALGQMALGLLQRGGDRGEPLARVEAVAVELIEQLRAGAGKEHLHGVLFAAQDRAEFRAISRAEQRLGKMAGLRLHILSQRGLRGVRGCCKCRRRAVTRGVLFQQAMLHDAGHQALERRLHRRGDAQRSGGEFSGVGDAHLAQTARELRGGEVVAGSH